MSSAATIQASIDSIDEEIGKLTEARQTLTDLLGDEEDTNGASEKPARRRQRSKDEDEKPARSSRSTRATSKRDQERKASSSTKASNGKGKGSKAEPSSRKEQIEAMLNDGMAPREVADELGIATNYVYNVRRTM